VGAWRRNETGAADGFEKLPMGRTKPWTVAGFGPTGSGREVLLLCGGAGQSALLFLDKKKKGKGYHRPSWFWAAVGCQKILWTLWVPDFVPGRWITSRAGSARYDSHLPFYYFTNIRRRTYNGVVKITSILM
jgi:hypothetical protein